jgi:hypothetical protein
LTPCQSGLVDWDDTDVAEVDALSKSLAARHLGCDDFLLQDRELLSHSPHYIDTGLPGAYGKCTVGDDPDVLIGSFVNGTVDLAPFLPAEQAFVCGEAKTTRVVAGKDWAVFLPKGEHQADVARALHGKPYGDACP